MSSLEWSDEELIVTVYFTSRGFLPEIVAEFLARRQLLRSLDSIHAKLLEITSTNPTLGMEAGVWDIQAVDKFIDGLSLDHDAVSQLIRFTKSDVNVVEKVCTHSH